MLPNLISYRSGTFRALTPEQTWERIRPMLPRFGITRVADVTRLDDIGVPVFLAYRPTSLTYAVSAGIGGTATHARVSAVMESIETWHAENVRLPVAARAPARDLDLGYRIRDLNLADRSPLTSDVVLDWVAGTGLLTGQSALAPLAQVRLDLSEAMTWNRVMFKPTSNGLATGSTHADAIVHGLLELIERDCVAAYLACSPDARRFVDPAACRNPLTRQILDAIRGAGGSTIVCDITGPTGVPCYAAVVWSPDVPFPCGGFGCHVDPGIALGRALAEAVQSRLAMISGSRDDVDYRAYRQSPPMPDPPSVESFPDAPDWTDDGDLISIIRHCASLVASVTGAEPFAVFLDHDDIGIPAVKVIAPGLLMMDEKLAATIGPMTSPVPEQRCGDPADPA